MPQMSPMWWMTLMFMFIMTMMLIMAMVYFNFNLMSSNKKEFKVVQYNWKW